MVDCFYCYAHRRKNDGSIFYFGKGQGTRASQTINRNRYWHNVVKKHGFFFEIIQENLSEADALRIEMDLIADGRRRGLKLVNLTDGGDGVSGFHHTNETKEKIRQKMLVIANSLEKKEISRKNGQIIGRQNVDTGRLERARMKSPIGKKGNPAVKYTNAKRWGYEKEPGLWVSKKTEKILLDEREING